MFNFLKYRCKELAMFIELYESVATFLPGYFSVHRAVVFPSCPRLITASLWSHVHSLICGDTRVPFRAAAFQDANLTS